MTLPQNKTRRHASTFRSAYSRLHSIIWPQITQITQIKEQFVLAPIVILNNGVSIVPS